MENCKHNRRSRYPDGFYCEDCRKFFPKSSPTYRSGELLDTIWMVLNNINAERGQRGLEYYSDVEKMKDKIGIGIKHDNYEEIIAEAEIIMTKYNKGSESARRILK